MEARRSIQDTQSHKVEHRYKQTSWPSLIQLETKGRQGIRPTPAKGKQVPEGDVEKTHGRLHRAIIKLIPASHLCV